MTGQSLLLRGAAFHLRPDPFVAVHHGFDFCFAVFHQSTSPPQNSPIIRVIPTPSTFTTIRNKLSGLKENLAFSNRWSVLAQRLFHPGHPLVSYLWKGRWWLVCDTRYQDANAAKEVLAGGCYDAFIARSARGGRLSYVNVGAHIGTFDIAVASLVAEVPFACSVEMHPGTFARLNFNLHLNGLSQVRTVNVGVGGEIGTATICTSGSSLAHKLSTAPGGNGATENGTSVPVLTLGALLDRAAAGDREFDLLKLDCEGAEYAIIAEAAPALLRRFAHLVIELHPTADESAVEDLWRKLASCGFAPDGEKPVAFTAGVLRFWTRNEP